MIPNAVHSFCMRLPGGAWPPPGTTMNKDHPLQRAAAFAAGALLVTWIGGTAGAVCYKTLYWLLFGAWPETAAFGLAPVAVIQAVLALPQGDPWRETLLYLLRLDVMTYIMAAPPVLLIPCLALLMAGQGVRPMFEKAARPFAAASGSGSMARIDPAFRRDRGLPACPPFPESSKNGIRG